MYTRLKKHEEARHKDMYDLAKLICSFINPKGAAEHFSAKPESVENVGFYDDLKAIDPNFDADNYADMLE
jgi:hypothetical protein